MSKNNLSLGSLFDGSGGFPLGGLISGITPVWASEIEPFPIRVTTKRLPFMKHYGDISQMDGGEIEPVDIITFGSPCFPAGTLVLTDQGYLEIEKIAPGMKVLTHKGRWRKVTDAGAKVSDTVVVKGNHYGLECTPNHPIYSATMYRQYKNRKTGAVRCISGQKEWTPADEMLGKLWAVPHTFEPLPMPRTPHDGNPKLKALQPFNEDFFYLVGRWLGDGWVRDRQRQGRPEGQRHGTIIICARYEKAERLKAAIEAVENSYSIEYCRTSVKFKFTSLLLSTWLVDNFGKYAHGKEIPSWAFSMPESWQRSLLQGILDTDGYQYNERTYRITTVSKKLAHGIRLLGEALGYSTTIFYVANPPTCVIENRICHQRNQYITQLIVPSRRSRLSDELHSWYRVRSILPTGEKKLVYNLTVDEDNSYIADGIVVHNCQDLSVAGKRAGIHDGDRSNLFFQAIRIIKEMRCATNGKYPRYCVWENVPGAFSSNGGEDFKAVLEAVIGVTEPTAQVPMPEKNRWPYADCYMGDGWSVAYRVLDAQFWGVPQRRKRIYLVADFAGGRAFDILFKSEGLSGYSAEGFRSWQRTAGSAADRTGTASLCLNDQGGQRMDVTDDVTATLRAEAHHPPCVLESAGFCTEHSSKSRSIGYEEETSPTLRAGVVPATVYENHSQDTRYTGPLDTAPTVSATYGMGGNNQPFVISEATALENHPTDSRVKIAEDGKVQPLTTRMGTGGGNVPLVMKIRSGCEGGGKGALIQENKSATLSCSNDQTLFEPVAFGICSKDSNSMKSDNPHSGIYKADTARTLDGNGGNPSCNQGGIAVVAFTQNQRDEVRDLGDHAAVVCANARTKQQTFVLQGSMIGREHKNGPQGDGINEDVSFTLNTVDRHAVYAMTTGSFTQVTEEQSPTLMARDFKDPNAVCYGIDRDTFNQGKNVKFAPSFSEEVQPTMVAKGPGAIQSGYTVRRLTPTECARLQGFPDWWCDDLGIEPTTDDLRYWYDVFETHRKIVDSSTKPKSLKQIAKWLRDPHSDAAEYKMWGNGVALPCVVFVLSGIVYYTQSEGK